MSNAKTIQPAQQDSTKGMEKPVCPSCGSAIGAPIVCSACGALAYPAPEWSHFDELELPSSFDLDTPALSRAYRAAARLVHPDRFNASDSRTLQRATRLSARINQAHATLADPLRRAEYLLDLSGGPGAAEVREVPGPLLMEVMDWREQLEAARTSGDQDAVLQLRTIIKDRQAQAWADVARQANALPGFNQEQRVEFRKLLNVLHYFDRLLHEMPVDPMAPGNA